MSYFLEKIPSSLDCIPPREYKNAVQYLEEFSNLHSLSAADFETRLPVLLKRLRTFVASSGILDNNPLGKLEWVMRTVSDELQCDVHIPESHRIEMNIFSCEEDDLLLLSFFIPENLNEYSNFLQKSSFIHVTHWLTHKNALHFYEKNDNSFILQLLQQGVSQLLKQYE